MVHVRQRFGASRSVGRAGFWARRADAASGEEGREGTRRRCAEDVVKLASRFGRYGYRRVTALLQAEGWQVNHKRVERIWRQEGLKVPKKHRSGAGCG